MSNVFVIRKQGFFMRNHKNIEIIIPSGKWEVNPYWTEKSSGGGNAEGIKIRQLVAVPVNVFVSSPEKLKKRGRTLTGNNYGKLKIKSKFLEKLRVAPKGKGNKKSQAHSRINALVRGITKKNAEVGYINDFSFINAFYNHIAAKFGEQSSKIAKRLVSLAMKNQTSTGSKALMYLDKHRDNINKNFSTRDRKAVGRALEAFDREQLAAEMEKFRKAFFYSGEFGDYYELGMRLKCSFNTNNWRPFYDRACSLFSGKHATEVAAFIFSVILVIPLGILGFGLIIAIVGALIDERIIQYVISQYDI